MNHIFYVVYYGHEKTVIESQVITPVRKISRDNISVTLVFFEDFKNWIKMGLWQDKQNRFHRMGLRAVFLPRIPRNFLGLNSAALFLLWWPDLLANKTVAVHARGFQGAACVGMLKRFFKKIRIICDARGVETEEYEYIVLNQKKRSLNAVERAWKNRLLIIEKQAVQNSDVVFSVSHAMIDFLKKRTAPPPNQKWEYVPCAVDVPVFSEPLSTRSFRRKEKGIDRRLVVLYSGSAQGWQAVPLLPKVFKLIQSIEPSAFLLTLTPNKEKFLHILENAGLLKEDYQVSSIEHHLMPEMVGCADIGLLLREDNPVNAYACPTKFSEYLACGLHVIATTAVWDIADFLRREPVGTLLEDLTDDRRLLESLKEAVEKSKRTAERISASTKAAQATFDWQHYVPIIKKWYLELLHQ